MSFYDPSNSIIKGQTIAYEIPEIFMSTLDIDQCETISHEDDRSTYGFSLYTRWYRLKESTIFIRWLQSIDILCEDNLNIHIFWTIKCCHNIHINIRMSIAQIEFVIVVRTDICQYFTISIEDR